MRIKHSNMLQFLRGTIAAVTLFWGSFTTTALAEEFTPAQKNEIIQVFQEFFLENPEIIREALIALEQKNQAKRDEQVRDIIKSQRNIIENPKGLFVAGNPNGDVTLIEFFDYNCQFCKQSLADILYLLENDKNLKIVFYETPIIEQSSLTAAHAALAAKKQNKYLAMHATFLSHQGSLDDKTIFAIAKKIGLDLKQLRADMGSKEVADAIERSADIAETLGIQGAPAYIIGDEIYRGYMSLGELNAKINEVRLNNKN